MRTITPYLVAKLYTWTVRDLGLVFNRCFIYNPEEKRYEGPSSSYALLLACLIDLWGSIMRDKFDVRDESKENVEKVLIKLCELDKGKNKKYYKIFDNGKINKDVVKLFRHNLVHDFGKKLEKPEYDLNIDTTGNVIDQQKTNKRWHINCKKLAEDFLNALRLELPALISK